MRFNGSAMRMPHEQGLFRSRIAHPVAQCLALPEGVGAGAAAGAEPLSVRLHALPLAPPLAGQRVLVTGAGPIGAICVALARLRGALDLARVKSLLASPVLVDLRNIYTPADVREAGFHYTSVGRE